jgi:four helix bundle protein
VFRGAIGFAMKNAQNPLRPRTKAFALRMVRLFASLPRSDEARIIGKQMLRSGTSVGANYREACRARSKAEFNAKAGDCLREIDETGYWLELLVDSGIESGEEINSLQNECNELTAIFVTILKRSKGLA